ncbi:MAG TPA: hypothetical protein VN397_01325 [Candidatus Methylomirabilis sp.]|nr:hypothetical protein [Candidatus Methylomirabilis sp.]
MLTTREQVPEVVRDYAASYVAFAESEGSVGPLLPDGDIDLYLLIQTDDRTLRKARWVKLWCIAYRAHPFRLFTLWIQTRERSWPGDLPASHRADSLIAPPDVISDNDWLALVETEIKLVRHAHIRVPQEKR